MCGGGGGCFECGVLGTERDGKYLLLQGDFFCIEIPYMKIISGRGIFLRLATAVAICAGASAFPFMSYFWNADGRIETLKLECLGAKVIEAMACVYEASLVPAPELSAGGATHAAESAEVPLNAEAKKGVEALQKAFERFRRACPAWSESANLRARALFSPAALARFARSADGATLAEMADFVSSASGLKTESEENAHMLMTSCVEIFPKIFSDVSKMRTHARKIASDDGDNPKTSSFLGAYMTFVSDVADINVCARGTDIGKLLNGARKTDFTKLNTAAADINVAVNKLWDGSRMDAAQMESLLDAFKAEGAAQWRRMAKILERTLENRYASSRGAVFMSAGIYAAVLVLAAVAATAILLRAYSKLSSVGRACVYAAHGDMLRARELLASDTAAPREVKRHISAALELLNNLDRARADQTETSAKSRELSAHVRSEIAKVERGIEAASGDVGKLVEYVGRMGNAADSFGRGVVQFRESVEHAANAMRAQSGAAEDSGAHSASAKAELEKVAELVKSARASIVSLRALAKIFEASAQQTNVLGLNMAMETARLGAEASGLGVMAEQVRDIARRMAVSASDMENSIAGAEGAVAGALERTENASLVSDSNAKASRRISEALARIRASLEAACEALDTGALPAVAEGGDAAVAAENSVREALRLASNAATSVDSNA